MKVSILIPTYNRAHTIRRALDSALHQSYDNYEIIVVDNASTDDTAHILHSEYKSNIESGRLQFFRYEELVPIYENWNRALDKASGDCVCFLFSDDTFNEDHVAKLVSEFEKNNRLVLCSSAINYIDEMKGDVFYKRRYARSKKTALLKSVYFRNSIGAPTAVMFRRCVLNNNKIRFSKNRVASDIIFMAQVLNYGEFNYLEGATSNLYISSTTETSTLKTSSRWILDNIESKMFLKETYLKLYGRTFFSVFFNLTILIYSSIIFSYLTVEEKESTKEVLKKMSMYNGLLFRIVGYVVNFKFIKKKLLIIR